MIITLNWPKYKFIENTHGSFYFSNIKENPHGHWDNMYTLHRKEPDKPDRESNPGRSYWEEMVKEI